MKKEERGGKKVRDEWRKEKEERGLDEIERKRSERKNLENEDSGSEERRKKRREKEEKREIDLEWEGRRERKERSEFKFKNSKNSLFMFLENRLYFWVSLEFSFWKSSYQTRF